MANGKVDVRISQRRKTARLRFYDVYTDQITTIQTALEQARQDAGTAHDTVALDAICMHYLSTRP